MIKKLRYKFLAVTMLCIGLLFAAILLALNLSMNLSSQRRGYEMLEAVADLPHPEEGTQGNGRFSPSERQPDAFPGKRPDNDMDAFRIFHITYSKDGEVLNISYNQESGLSEEDILALGAQVWQSLTDTDSPKERGRASSRYLYLIRDREDALEIYFLNYSVEQSMTYQLFYLCLFVGVIGMVVLFVAVYFLSGWMVRPIQTAFLQQKQFIADASHELKTPLTIINANAEVLAGTIGPNRWLSHILEQTRRMNALIRDLLDLAKMDAIEDGQKAAAFSEFDLSRAVSSVSLSFESLAFESHRRFQMQISEGLTCWGDEQAVRQLVTILLDNAFKYSDDRGTISIALSAKKILTVTNTGSGISPEDQKHIFERFYRSDSSRSRETGGYGLGLSIAASIARSHKAKIGVSSDGQSYTRISVTF